MKKINVLNYSTFERKIEIGQNVRVFSLFQNWTELDVWSYIEQEEN